MRCNTYVVWKCPDQSLLLLTAWAWSAGRHTGCTALWEMGQVGPHRALEFGLCSQTDLALSLGAHHHEPSSGRPFPNLSRFPHPHSGIVGPQWGQKRIMHRRFLAQCLERGACCTSGHCDEEVKRTPSPFTSTCLTDKMTHSDHFNC